MTIPKKIIIPDKLLPILKANNYVSLPIKKNNIITHYSIYRIAYQITTTDATGNIRKKFVFKNYITNQDGFLGQGTFGMVHKLYPINDDGEIDEHHPVAIKICFPNKQPIEDQKNALTIELTSLRSFLKNTSVISTLFMPDYGPCFAFTMEYINAKPLSAKSTRAQVEKLTFTSRILLILQGILFSSFLHNHRPAIIHKDIKPDNSLVSIEEKDGTLVLNHFFVDFGLSVLLKHPHLQSLNIASGTWLTAAPEIIGNMVGPKSDVFSYACNVLFFLGAMDQNVLCRVTDLDRPKIKNTHQNSIYNMNGFLAAIELPGTHPNRQLMVRTLLIKFIFRMMQKEYHPRAETNEVVAFFQALYTLCLLYEKKRLIIQCQRNTLTDTRRAILVNFTPTDIKQSPDIYQVSQLEKEIKTNNVLQQLTTDELKVFKSIPAELMQKYVSALLALCKFDKDPDTSVNINQEIALARNRVNQAVNELETLSKKQIALIEKLSEAQIEYLLKSPLTSSQWHILTTVSEKQRKFLSQLSDTERNEANELIKLLREIYQESKQPVPAQEQEFTVYFNAQLKKLQTTIQRQTLVLLAKMAILTATTVNESAVDTHQPRLAIFNDYPFEKNPDVCELILVLAMNDKKRFNFNNNEPLVIAELIDTMARTNRLTLKRVTMLCDEEFPSEMVKALLKLYKKNCSVSKYLSLFFNAVEDQLELPLEYQFAKSVAKMINTLPEDMTCYKNIENTINQLLSDINKPPTSISQQQNFSLMGQKPRNKTTVLKILESLTNLQSNSPSKIAQF